MSAQYRPYRDEDSCDGVENDHLNWNDNEPGSVQIYEKTTEDLPFKSNRRFILSALGVISISIVIGFIIGYFSHSQHTTCIPNISVALHSTKNENLRIRQRIIDNVRSSRIEAFVEEFSSEPRLPGSARDLYLIKRIQDEFRRNSFDKVETKNYSVLLSLPDEENPNFVEIIDSTDRKPLFSSLNKVQNDKNKWSPFCAYSPKGDVVGDIVFVNYGTADDYQLLQDKYNITFDGKILIAKQFHLAADEQVLWAQSRNAAALLLYSEPADYVDDKRSESQLPDDAVRSDSLLWNGLGDPLTPGYPSTHYALRVSAVAMSVLPKIPVQPISVHTAYELLGLMGGKEVPKEWAGLFNFTYRLGPGFQNTSLKLRLKVNNKLVNTTISNVIGYIRGDVEPDRYVILGNHRDSWVNGAIDSAGGTGAFLELVEVFGGLVKSGWRPRRTILFCSWGAEEFNLIGSTEWLEENYKTLYSRAVAYINADIVVVGNGSLSVDASPLLYNAIFNATKEVPNPDTNDEHTTIYEKWLNSFPIMRNSTQLIIPMNYLKNHFIKDEIDDYDSEIFEGKNDDLIDRIEGPSLFQSYLNSATIQIRPNVRQLNARSVYSPFFTFAGIPSLEMTYISFLNPKQQTLFSLPPIHTQYDDFKRVSSVIDPGFKYHKAVTQIIGEIVRDLSDSLFIPFNLLHYAQVLQDLSSALQSRLLSLNSSQGVDLNLLNSAINNFTKAALKFHYNQEKADLRDPMSIRRINDQLLLLERTFLDTNGLPRNIMKKHVIMSPSEILHSYDDTFPGLIDEFAILSRSDLKGQNWDIIRAHFSILVFTIQSAANALAEI
ncbi:N-acetylated-alpha-linked acidic dipeptidase 2-like protein [Dinothrombium tinctorium]|uniref:Aminopeptidase NAALADL1 n=1 Tax=Dinothrombium tinctorium TaxID=1965070 RepID=A0A443RC18_9ACAR|nr:N-acetylated-alpha-linked acidic dipeptidase 2-like protein [Dinothrombium tinctorium]